MKKVILDIQSAEIALFEDVKDRYYYGILKENLKGIIIREKYSRGKYRFMAALCITMGNSWEHYNNQNLKDGLSKWINDGGSVYQFDTPMELFAWLAS